MRLKNRRASRLLLSLLASTFLACMGTPAASAQTSSAQPDATSRVSAHPDLTPKTRLTGHLPRWAAAAQDLGAIAPDRPLDHLVLTLTRPAALEAQFQQLLRDQQDPASPRYHQWLTPQQSATLYAAPQADSDAVVAWLQSQGLQVDSVSPNRLLLTFSGPASAVAGAFSVQLHSFQHLGRTVYSATSEPAIPTALAAVIQGVAGLSEEYLAPAHTMLAPQAVRNSGSSMTPDVNLSGGAHWLAPADFNLIYDVTPVLNSGITGTGQHIAIIGASRVLPADISAYESLTGLPSAQPNSLVTPNSTDPGMTSDSSQGEATLDVDRVLSTAPGSTADLVLISSLLNTQILASLQYIVNTLNDPIINMSFGSCEYYSGQSAQSTFNTILAQAASQGISTFVSAGDSEAAGCMTAGGPYTPSLAVASTNVLCTQYVTCVGGTQFADTASPSTYWAATNNSTTLLSVLSYIPEGVWNEPVSTSTTGVVSYVVEGGGGGPSLYLAKPAWQVATGVPADNARDTPDVSFSASGHNAYLACLTYSGAVCPNTVTGFGGTSAAAPSMAGILALVNQKTAVRQGLFNARLYQLSLTSSNGIFHDATPATSGVTTCSLLTASTCNTSTPGISGLTGGLPGAALTTGYDLATGLGSIDVAKLIAAVTASTAATTTTLTATPATINVNQSAVFKAVVTSTTAGTPTGTVTFTSTGPTLGTFPLSGAAASTSATTYPTAGTYTVTAIYSGDSTYAASASTTSFVVTTPPLVTPAIALTGTTGTIAPTQQVTYTATLTTSSGTPTGTVSFYNNGTSFLGSASVIAGKATFGPTVLSPGFYSVTAVYSGDTSFATVTSSALAAIVTGVPTSVLAIPAAATYSSLQATQFFQSNLDLFSSSGVTAGVPTVGPTGTITYNVDGVNSAPIPIVGSLNNGYSSIYIANSPTYTLSVAVHHVTASYSGDAIWAPSTSAVSVITVAAAPTATTVALTTPATVYSGVTTPITVTVTGLGTALTPTGKITLTDYLTGGGTTTFGTFAFTSLGSTSGTLSYTLPALVTGTHQIQATFNSGTTDPNYQASAGSLSFIVAPGSGQSFTVSAAPSTLTVAAGATTGNSFTATYTSVGGFQGTISPSPCSVSANFSAATVMPYCNASYLVATVGTSTPGTNIFTLTTTKRSAITGTGLALNRTGALGGAALSSLLLLLLPGRRRRALRRWSTLLPILLLAAGLLSASGCGGASSSSGGGTTTVNGTTAGSYTVTLGGIAGNVSTVTTTVTLNVQ